MGMPPRSTLTERSRGASARSAPAAEPALLQITVADVIRAVLHGEERREEGHEEEEYVAAKPHWLAVGSSQARSSVNQ